MLNYDDWSIKDYAVFISKRISCKTVVALPDELLFYNRHVTTVQNDNKIKELKEKNTGKKGRPGNLYRFDKDKYFQLKKKGIVFEIWEPIFSHWFTVVYILFVYFLHILLDLNIFEDVYLCRFYTYS